jgi:hypothetical protein
LSKILPSNTPDSRRIDRELSTILLGEKERKKENNREKEKQ